MGLRVCKAAEGQPAVPVPDVPKFEVPALDVPLLLPVLDVSQYVVFDFPERRSEKGGSSPFGMDEYAGTRGFRRPPERIRKRQRMRVR
jgi:hypothetical protein